MVNLFKNKKIVDELVGDGLTDKEKELKRVLIKFKTEEDKKPSKSLEQIEAEMKEFEVENFELFLVDDE